MKSGLDLSKFKKTGSDKDCTTLRHKDGHEIKIAHHKLSAKMRGDLEKLPGDEPQKFSGGGPVQGPCMNENCKSYGHVHPNCKCYGGFAKGGMAKSYCADGKPHMNGCQYFVNGGEAEPQDQVDQAQSQQVSQQPAPGGGVTIINNPSPMTQVPQIGPQAQAAPNHAPVASKNWEDRYAQDMSQKPTLAPQSNAPMPGIGAPLEQSAAQGIAQEQPPQEAPKQEKEAPMLSGEESLNTEPDKFASQQIPPNGGPPVAGTTMQEKQEPTFESDPAGYLLGDDAAWNHDLRNGHIPPKTIQSLFHDKSTLGKIGTIFGLLVSGAGSGMAHQSNALLDQMNKEVQNDFEAQKASKNNAHGMLSLLQQHNYQEAHMKQMGQQGKLTESEVKNKDAQTDLLMQSSFLMKQNRNVVQALADTVNKLPPGSPDRVKAEQTLAAVSDAVDAKNFTIAQKAAAQMALLKAKGIDMSGAPLKAGPSGGIDTDAAAVQLRKLYEMKHIDQSQYDKANEELKMVENKNRLNKMALDAFDRVATLSTLKAHAKDPFQIEQKIKAAWEPVIGKLTRDNDGRVVPLTMENMSNLEPGLKTSKKTIPELRGDLKNLLNGGYATPILNGLKMTPAKGGETQSESGGTSSSSGNSDMVSVTNAQGKRFSVPRSNLKKALSRGYKEAQ